MPAGYTQESFVAKAADVHRTAPYTFAKVVYAGSRGKVTVTCATHGDFERYFYNPFLKSI